MHACFMYQIFIKKKIHFGIIIIYNYCVKIINLYTLYEMEIPQSMYSQDLIAKDQVTLIEQLP